MKKKISLLLCLAMLVSAFTCGASACSTTNVSDGQTSTNEADEPAVVDLEDMEVGDIVYVGDIAIERASDDVEEPSEPITRKVTSGFSVTLTGNTSVDKALSLNSEFRYFYICVKNTGSNKISITIGNNESTQSNNYYNYGKGTYYIYSTSKWPAKSQTVSFSSGSKMSGSATAKLCSTLDEAKSHGQ